MENGQMKRQTGRYVKLAGMGRALAGGRLNFGGETRYRLRAGETLLDLAAVTRFLESPKDYGAPWYGQLMAGPQMIAWLLQTEYFLRKYNVRIQI